MMTARADHASVTIADVDREMATRIWWGRFAPAIEVLFNRSVVGRRRRWLVISGICAICLYDVFLYNDWLTLRDMFSHLVVARLAIFTPIVALVLVTIARTRSVALHDGLAVMVAVLAVFMPMTLLIFSDSSEKASYQYGTLIVLMFVTTIQRLRFRFAVLATCILITIQLVTTAFGNVFVGSGYSANILFFSSVGILLMLTSFMMEQQERRSYLFALQGQLLLAQMESAARTDALTGLGNRRRLKEVCDDLQRHADSDVSAILLDIDHFKKFNDAAGHLAGDDCLTIVAACVARTVLPAGGHAFRYGGEEFLVLLNGCDTAKTEAVAEAIAASIRAECIVHPGLPEGSFVTASIGFAEPRPVSLPMQELIAAADTALYLAKRHGRNRVWPARLERIAPPAALAASA